MLKIVAGKSRRFPFNYAARWRSRLIKPFKQNAHLIGDIERALYERGLIHQFGNSEGAWIRGNEIRAICGQRVDEGKSLVGTAMLSFQVFGMSNERRENFLQLHPFVMGLAGEEMYEKALAFLGGGQRGALTTEEEVRSIVTGWIAEGFYLRISSNLPSGC